MSAVRLFVPCGLVLLIGGCVQVPDLAPTTESIPTSEIVARVKCEINDAVQPYLINPRYAWLRKWTAQADLNLIVNNQAGVSPGAIFTQPLKSVALTGKGTFAQSFSFGAGAGASTTAIRNEVVSFSLSFDEIAHDLSNPIDRQQLYNECRPWHSWDLIGNLGLKEWVDSALQPVRDGYLYPGNHPTPKGPSGGASANLKGATDLIQEKLSEPKIQSTTPSKTAGTLAKIEGELRTVAKTPNVTKIKEIIVEINKLLPTVTDGDLRGTLISIRTLLSASLPAPPKPENQNPPIDALSHQVQFLVAWNASLNPTWSLVNVKGPSPASGSLFSGTQTNTHTLTIVLGPPSSPAVTTQRTSLANAAMFSNFLSIQPNLFVSH
jgi:hypothetical protein